MKRIFITIIWRHHCNDDGLIDICPNGQIPKKQTLSENRTLTAIFDIKICNVCPLKEKCIAYKNDKQSRIQIDKHREFIDNRKSFQYTLEYESLAKLRPNVEALGDLRKGFLRWGQ